MSCLGIALIILFFPLATLAQELPDTNQTKNQAFLQAISQIEDRIIQRGDNPTELPVGYQFTNAEGDTFALADGENPWSKLYDSPEYFGQPTEKDTQQAAQRADPDTTMRDTAAVKTADQDREKSDSWWYRNVLVILTLAVAVVLFLLSWIFASKPE